jgi:hypothetical protein
MEYLLCDKYGGLADSVIPYYFFISRNPLDVLKSGLYGVSEGYGILLVTELVDTEDPWVITGYGLSQVWFRTESTVVTIACLFHACTTMGL